MHQRHDWELQTRFQSPVQANFSVGIVQDLSSLKDFNWIVSVVKSYLMDKIYIQLWIAAVGKSPSGLWFTCVHAKQLQRDPMFM